MEGNSWPENKGMATWLGIACCLRLTFMDIAVNRFWPRVGALKFT